MTQLSRPRAHLSCAVPPAHLVTPFLIPPCNDPSLNIPADMSAEQQFRCLIQLARTLAQNPDLADGDQLLCDLFVEAAVSRQRKPPVTAARTLAAET